MSTEKKGDCPETVLVMPVSGKYCEVVYSTEGGATSSYRVWKVNPNTPDTFGTRIPYDVAVTLLGKVPPVITLVPETKDGKFVTQLLKEDQEKIQASQKLGFSGGRNYNSAGAATEPSGGTGDSEALKKTSALLKEQVQKNSELEGQLSALTDRLAKLEATVPKTK